MKKFITRLMILVTLIFILIPVSSAFASNGIWTTKASMPSEKHYFGTAEINGIIYIIGGRNATTTWLNTVEAYDTAANTWSSKASLPSPRSYLSAVAVNGKIYAIGGQTGSVATKIVEVYDPATNSWTRVADMISARTRLSVAVYNNKIYAFGGATTVHLSSVEMYDPITNTWTLKANMPTAKSDSATATANGKIYSIGGIGGVSGGAMSTVEEYDPILNTWAAKHIMPGIRTTHRAVAMNNKVYVFGGTSGPLTNLVWEYNTVSNSWTSKADIPTPRRFLGGESVNGTIYALGGQSGNNTLNTVEAYTLDAPLSPTNLSANVVNNQVSLSWTKVFGAESYNIKRSLSQGGSYTSIATGINTTNFTDTNVNRGVTYYYVLTASNVVGESVNSNEVTSTISPDTISNLTVTSGNAIVGLSWVSSSGATSYKVKRSSVNGGPYTQIASNVLTTSYNDALVTNGSTYYYIVTANNAGGESGNSNQAIGNPQIPAPSAPINFAASSGDTEVTLNWSSVSTAVSYNVKRSNTSNGTYNIIANVSSNAYLDTLVTNGVTYYYKVSANNAGGESANSGFTSATPQVLTPLAPQNLIAVMSNQEVSLSWDSTSGATEYNIKRSLTTGGPYTSIVSVIGTTYNDINVINGIKYYYVVTATNLGGESGTSNEASAIPQVPAPDAPIDLVASARDAQVELNWSSVTAADSYSIKRALLAGGPYTTIISSVTALTYNDATVTNGVTYYYVISAINGGGESNNSIEVKVTPLSSTNIAPTSTVAASSEFNSSNYKKTNVVDGIIGHATNGQWASLGELTPWISLTWSESKTIHSIKLYDRPNTNNISAGVLTFSDGSTIDVDALDAAGAVKEISFPSKTVTWVKFTVTSGSGVNVGLSEVQVYGF